MHTSRAFTAWLVLLIACLVGTASAFETRAIPLDGVPNTRDLGGLQTTDGRSVRAGQLIRSGRREPARRVTTSR